MPRRTPIRRHHTGSVSAEFALLLPVLVFLGVLCIDFGRFAYTYIGVHNAARAGAAHAIMTPFNASDSDAQSAWMLAVRDKAREEMTNQTGYNANNLTVTTTFTDDPTTGFRDIRVQASYTSFQTLVPWPGVPRPLTLTKAVEMRAIR